MYIMKKLPMGISNYEKMIEENYYYVDKTEYIEKLENFANPTVMFLRPRKFGKTLFTSVLENYYDFLKKDKFEILFKETYIGKNPTNKRNSYHILCFNFSGIDTKNEETTIKSFRKEVASSVKYFIEKYSIDFYIKDDDESEDILNNLFKAFRIQKQEDKIYVIIDEYDHFTNEILTFNKFEEMVTRNGKICKWYEVLKQGTETVVDRIFITGVMPITLDSLISGFNIATDITRDVRFNNMVGFSKEEIIEMMNEQNISEGEQEKLLPIMKENYDGYKFSISADTQMYNSNMSLYFLSNYIGLGKMPESLIDVNIASDYSKLSNMLMLCTSDQKAEIIENSLTEEPITSVIVEKFNPKEDFGMAELKIPNKIMKELYGEFFLNEIKINENLSVDSGEYNAIIKELALKGKIDGMLEVLKRYLKHLSNRDYKRFDEKYVKVLFYSIAMNLKQFYNVKSEVEVERNYTDLLIVPRDRNKGYNSALIEFKYLKKEEIGELEETKEKARKQLIDYAEKEEIKDIENLHKYIVVAVVDEIYVDKIE